MKLVSYILPVYNEAENLPKLWEVLNSELKAVAKRYKLEFIFINDGSRDDSLDILLSIQQSDPRVKVIDFSRNFGHQMAITAGLDHAAGDAAIIMDSDLQDPPRVSIELITKWQEGYEVVYAKRRTRQDSFMKKLTAKWFYFILDKMADIRIPRDTGDFRLLDRKVIEHIKLFREKNRYMRGMVTLVGFKQVAVLFDRDSRFAGKTGYSITKMFRLAFDAVTSFSSKPLWFILYLGIAVSFFSFLGILYAIFVKLAHPWVVLSGWTFLIIAVLFIGGVQMIMLGILGVYIGRIYSEVQRRPLYIIADIYGPQTKTKG